MINGRKMRKSSRLNQIRLMIESRETSRREEFKRLNFSSTKIVKGRPLRAEVQ